MARGVMVLVTKQRNGMRLVINERADDSQTKPNKAKTTSRTEETTLGIPTFLGTFHS